MVEGNLSAALALCKTEELGVKATGERAAGAASEQAAAQPAPAPPDKAAAPLPEAPEIWILAARALHLCGRTADAKDVLKRAVACNLDARPPGALDSKLRLQGAAQQLADAIRDASSLSSRDRQRCPAPPRLRRVYPGFLRANSGVRHLGERSWRLV
jgi:hypothetical protein